jgi:hypothetical protein
MGRIKKGIQGGFSGTVGTVVGANWNGIDYMRSLPPERNTSKTTPQAAQRARFALFSKFQFSMKELLTLGFRDFAVQMTAPNSALSYNMKNAIIGVYPNFSILYDQVLVTRGSLPNVSVPAAAAGTSGTVTFSWTNNAGIGKAKGGDTALLVAYCPELNHTVYTTAGALRSAGTDTLNVQEFKGKVVQTWISFISVDKKDIATSLFTGEVSVA